MHPATRPMMPPGDNEAARIVHFREKTNWHAGCFSGRQRSVN
jgi:hypothetical protein